MRFNSEAYNKLFPREEPKPVVESAVDTFKPSENVKEIPEEDAEEPEEAETPAEEE